MSARLERVMARDASVHIPISNHQLREINERALLVDLLWGLVIDNSEFQDERAIAHQHHKLRILGFTSMASSSFND